MHPTEAIRYCVQGAFRGVKETPEVLEQQEEIIADLTAKVEDLVSEGTPEAEALGIALASVGDLSALVVAFETEGPAAVPAVPVFSARLDFHVRALTVALGGVLMALSVVVGAVFGVIYPGAGLALLIVLAVAAWWGSGPHGAHCVRNRTLWVSGRHTAGDGCAPRSGRGSPCVSSRSWPT